MFAMPIILESLPKTATLRKLNDLIKRARLAKVLFELFFQPLNHIRPNNSRYMH